MEDYGMAELATLERINKEIEYYDLIISILENGDTKKALELMKKHREMLIRTKEEK